MLRNQTNALGAVTAGRGVSRPLPGEVELPVSAGDYGHYDRLYTGTALRNAVLPSRETTVLLLRTTRVRLIGLDFSGRSQFNFKNLTPLCFEMELHGSIEWPSGQMYGYGVLEYTSGEEAYSEYEQK